MRFRNPCKQCLVQAACTELCEDKIEYGEKIGAREGLYLVLISGGGALMGGLGIVNIYEMLGIESKFIEIVTVIIYCFILSYVIVKMSNRISRERDEYLQQRLQKLNRAMDMNNQQPTFPPTRKVR